MAGKIFEWTARVVAAIIMLQTLYFKFAGAPESVYIFSTVGMEPWGRYGVGIGELFASILILIPRTSWMGALITVGLMVGAIAMHTLFLGFEVMNDGGQLFIYAVVAMTSGIIVLWMSKSQMKNDIDLFLRNPA